MRSTSSLLRRTSALGLGAVALIALSGCSSLVNTAGSGEYACPGMPMGVTCKTPSAVYKSTHKDPAITDFDTPIGSALLSERAGSSHAPTEARAAASSLPGLASMQVAPGAAGPRPVREPSRVARIWIAPWVDKHDNLHLAQTHYAEIKPRTWTVGKPEVASGANYVIPHRAFDKIADPAGLRAPEAEPSQSGNSQAKRDAGELVAPPN